MAIFSDVDFALFNDDDSTKTLRFNVSALSSNVLRVVTMPDVSTTMAGTTVDNVFDGANTFTNNATMFEEVLALAVGIPVRFYGSVEVLDLVASPTATRTVTLPDATTTLAGLAVPSQTWTEENIFTGNTEFDADGSGTNPFLTWKDTSGGKIASFILSGAPAADYNITFPKSSAILGWFSGAPTSGRVLIAGSNGQVNTDSDLNFATDTLTTTKLVITTSLTTVGGTAPVADGTYTVGDRITPVTGALGTITTKSGIVTAVQQAT